MSSQTLYLCLKIQETNKEEMTIISIYVLYVINRIKGSLAEVAV